MAVYGLWLKTWGDPTAARSVAQTRRVHKATPRELIAQQIDAVEAGKEIVFELGQIYVKPFITVLRNPAYPGEGKRYRIFQEGRAGDGSPSGKRGKVWDTNDSRSIAQWLLDREGHLFRAPATATS